MIEVPSSLVFAATFVPLPQPSLSTEDSMRCVMITAKLAVRIVCINVLTMINTSAGTRNNVNGLKPNGSIGTVSVPLFALITLRPTQTKPLRVVIFVISPLLSQRSLHHLTLGNTASLKGIKSPLLSLALRRLPLHKTAILSLALLLSLSLARLQFCHLLLKSAHLLHQSALLKQI